MNEKKKKKIQNNTQKHKKRRKINLTRGTVILTSPQQIFLRPQPIFCERVSVDYKQY